MFRVLVSVLGAFALALPAAAQVQPFPGDFRTQEITTDDGATMHLRSGGQGPAVVLFHGFGDTGDMWAPLAAALARDYPVVVPDLRGLGLSSHPADGYDKRTQAADVRAVLTHLGIDRAVIVGHDLGPIVAYADAARYPDTTEKLVVMDAPIPGIPPWDEIVRQPLLWHFSLGGPDAERLVAGREPIYLDRFWNEFAGDPAKAIDETTRILRRQFWTLSVFGTERPRSSSLWSSLPIATSCWRCERRWDRRILYGGVCGVPTFPRSGKTPSQGGTQPNTCAPRAGLVNCPGAGREVYAPHIRASAGGSHAHQLCNMVRDASLPLDGKCRRRRTVRTPRADTAVQMSSPPSSFAIIQPGTGVPLQKFWMPVHAAITLFLVLSLAFTWRQVEVRRLLLIGLGSYIVMRG